MRALIVVAAALLIVWQGGCLTIENGALINRCGLWQWASGSAMRFGLGHPDRPSAPIEIIRERVIERVIEKPQEVIGLDDVKELLRKMARERQQLEDDLQRERDRPPRVIYKDLVIEKQAPTGPPVIIYQQARPDCAFGGPMTWSTSVAIVMPGRPPC